MQVDRGADLMSMYPFHHLLVTSLEETICNCPVETMTRGPAVFL